MQQSVRFDLGERRHVKMIVKPVCGDDIPFAIRNARWELVTHGDIVDNGECTITDHELDIVIEPQKIGSYNLKVTYEIADETWVDNITVEVD